MKVGPYLGLTPRQHQSGESEWIGGIGMTNDPLLRSYLYEAAGVGNRPGCLVII
jgi:transposase